MFNCCLLKSDWQSENETTSTVADCHLQNFQAVNQGSKHDKNIHVFCFIVKKNDLFQFCLNIQAEFLLILPVNTVEPKWTEAKIKKGKH